MVMPCSRRMVVRRVLEMPQRLPTCWVTIRWMHQIITDIFMVSSCHRALASGAALGRLQARTTRGLVFRSVASRM